MSKSNMPSTIERCEGLKIKKKSPAEQLQQSIRELLAESTRFSNEDVERLVQEVPHKWERHGDLIVIPQHSLRNDSWKDFGDELFNRICLNLKVRRIARKNPVKSNVYRSSNVELLWGENGVVEHTDNKIKYHWDITKCMFSIGNITEKLRIAKFDCSQEVVVDLFAGIGYFVLPYLIHARAKHVHACEINPDSVEALQSNLKSNGVEERCTVYLGDNRNTCPKDVADRVNLGLIPSSELSWETACQALKSDSGGVLHIHANIDSKHPKFDVIDGQKSPFKYPDWEIWTEYASSTILRFLQKLKGRAWTVKFLHIEHVKSYAPHVDHVVLDLECRPVP